MPLTTVVAAKEASPLTYQPLLLAAITFLDGTVLRLSTHPLNTAQGGVQPSGISGFPHNSNDFSARLHDQDLAAIQSLGEQGVDMVSSAVLHIEDSDASTWVNYEKAKGFKGATLVLYLVFYDVVAGSFSTDYQTRFSGICDPANTDDGTLTVTANARTLARVLLPVFPVQKTCPLIFPTTAAERQAGADDESSQWFECGYSPDATGSNARGTYQSGTTPFTDCGRTKADCQARGMWDTDSSARATRRFAGIQWDPPLQWAGRSYLSGKQEEGNSNSNEAKYRDYFPLVYGTVWVEPIILNWIGDPNSSRGEMALCIGELSGSGATDPGDVQRVIVNDIEIPFARYLPNDPLFRWQWVANGGRTGAFNADIPWNSQGDPYGSIAVIEVVVPRKIAESSSIPSVRVLMNGPKVRNYWVVDTNGTTVNMTYGGSMIRCSIGSTVNINGTNYTVSADGHSSIVLTSSAGVQSGVLMYAKVRTDCPVWHMMDMHVWSNYTYADFDDTWARAASVSGNGGLPTSAQVTYTDLVGSTRTHDRYRSSAVIRDRRTAAEVIRGMRMGMKSTLVYNNNTSKLQLFPNQTLADQQPSPVTGSNYNTAVSSKNYAGSATNGYVAYKFNESSIARSPNNGPPMLSIRQRPIADAPNRISSVFQDEDNLYFSDSIGVVDAEDVARSGNQEIPGGINIYGANNYDQVRRVIATMEAESYRGNTRADTGGTLIFDFVTNFRAAHLRVGHICLFEYQKYALTNVLIRIISIKPSTNFEECRIVATFHNDNWYTDAWGQKADPEFSRWDRSRLDRPPMPWHPDYLQPPSGNPMASQTDYAFGVAQSYEENITKLTITGKIPVGLFSNLRPPFHARQGTTASTGGTLPGDSIIYVVLVGYDSSNLLTTPSDPPCVVAIPAGTSTNTASATGINWPSGTVGYRVYAGYNMDNLGYQGGRAATPSTVMVGASTETGDSWSWKDARTGPPDVEFASLVVKIKRDEHAGVLGVAVTGVTATTITVSIASWTTDQFAGRIASIVGKYNSTSPFARIDFTILSNTATVLTFSGVPDLTTLVAVGDALVIRTKATTSTSTTIGDSNFINSLAPSGLSVDAEKGRLVYIIHGTGKGQTPRTIISNTSTVLTVSPAFDVTPDSTSVFVVLQHNWQDVVTFTPSKNGDPDALVNGVINISNYFGKTLWVQVYTLDPEGSESMDRSSPWREIFVYGLPAGPDTQDEGYNILTIVGGAVTPDITVAVNHRVTATQNITINAPSGAASAGQRLTLKVIQDATGGRTLTFNAAYTGLTNLVPDLAPNTYSTYNFVYNGTDWECRGFVTGLS